MKYKAKVLKTLKDADKYAMLIQFNENESPSDFDHGEISGITVKKNNVLINRKFWVENNSPDDFKNLSKVREGDQIVFEKVNLLS